MNWTKQDVADFISKNKRVPRPEEYDHKEAPTFQDFFDGFIIYLQRFHKNLLQQSESINRDYIAVQLMKALISNGKLARDLTNQDKAKVSYEMADALIKERENQRNDE